MFAIQQRAGSLTMVGVGSVYHTRRFYVGCGCMCIGQDIIDENARYRFVTVPATVGIRKVRTCSVSILNVRSWALDSAS